MQRLLYSDDFQYDVHFLILYIYLYIPLSSDQLTSLLFFNSSIFTFIIVYEKLDFYFLLPCNIWSYFLWICVMLSFETNNARFPSRSTVIEACFHNPETCQWPLCTMANIHTTQKLWKYTLSWAIAPFSEFSRYFDCDCHRFTPQPSKPINSLGPREAYVRR